MSTPALPVLQDSASSAADSGFFRFLLRQPGSWRIVLAAILMIPGLIGEEILGHGSHGGTSGQDAQGIGWIAVLSIAATILAGLPIARSAWRALVVGRRISIDVLMTIAAIGALAIGAATEAGMVVVLFTVGEALESYSARRARQSIGSLMRLSPETALQIESVEGSLPVERQIPAAEVQPGDRLLLRPGDRLPVDGEVVSGHSTLDASAITGESRPVDVKPGSEVLAGCVNGSGVLEIEATRPASESTLARMIALVENAQSARSPSQRMIDRFAAVYTPVVIVLAVLVAAVPPLVFGQPFLDPASATGATGHGWLYRALALLVIACPCALVLSTPVTIASALANAAGRGLLIKGGIHLETLGRVRAIAFDKTGTLTLGSPTVIDVRAVDCELPGTVRAPDGSVHACEPCDHLLALASAVEQRSEHPLAHAVVAASTDRGLGERFPAAEGVEALVGRAVAGTVAGHRVEVGSHAHFDESIPHGEDHCIAAKDDSDRGRTPLLVSEEGRYLGKLAVSDEIRPSAAEAVDQLKAMGIEEIVMLTGDSEGAGRTVAQHVGIDSVHAGLLPEAKTRIVRELEERYGVVAMVGDGINDAPALATASVGLALAGASGGTDQAIESGDVTVLSDDLRRLPEVFELARSARSMIRTNIGVALGLKAAFVALAIGGITSLWLAVLADVGATILVSANGLRMLRWKPRIPRRSRATAADSPVQTA